MTGTYTNTTIGCINCYEKQTGACKGNPENKPCRDFCFRSEYCSECQHYWTDYCALYDMIISGADISCDDYLLPEYIRKLNETYLPKRRSRK